MESSIELLKNYLKSFTYKKEDELEFLENILSILYREKKINVVSKEEIILSIFCCNHSSEKSFLEIRKDLESLFIQMPFLKHFSLYCSCIQALKELPPSKIKGIKKAKGTIGEKIVGVIFGPVKPKYCNLLLELIEKYPEAVEDLLLFENCLSKNNFEIDNFPFVKKLEKYCEEKQKQFLKNQKGKWKQKKLIEDLLEEIKTFSLNEPFKLSKKYISNLPLELLIPISREVLNYNQAIYKKLKEKNDKNRTIMIYDLLKKYNLNDAFLEDELLSLSSLGLEKLENILSTLKKLPITFSFSKEEIVYICLNSNEENIKRIHTCLILQFLQLEFLKEYISIFGNSLQRILEKNMNLLIKENIKVANLNALLFNEELENLFSLGHVYELDLNDENILKNITKPTFFDSCDLMIELGIYESVKKDPSLFNEDLRILAKRIIIARNMHIEVLEEDDLLENKIRKNFFLPDSLLDDYLLNRVPTLLNQKDSLVLANAKRLQIEESCVLDEEYQKDSLTYLFGNVKISRPKVLRNLKALNPLENLMSCICYSSILTQEELEEIAYYLPAQKLSRIEKK